MPFDSPDVKLDDLLKAIRDGKLQLPDFQRPWKWDDDRIRGLLATVTRDYPIGVVMTLETGGEGGRFKPKPLAGSPDANESKEPEQLLLDGQQRLTSLFQALASGQPVETTDGRGKRLRRWYYLDIDRALGAEADREDAIISVPEDRIVRTDFGRKVVADYSTRAAECAAEMFPLSLAFDSGALISWSFDYAGGNAHRLERWKQFYGVLQNLTGYVVPVIKLTKATPKEAVCTVFEKVNTGGVPLTVFELLTATFAGDPKYFRANGADFRLNDYWHEVQDRLAGHPVLRDLESTDFLQAITLLATRARKLAHTGEAVSAPGVSCKRDAMLRLSLDDFLTYAPKVTEALEHAAAFLGQEHIFDARDVPYRTQLVPLAAVLAAAGESAHYHGADAKLRQWFWCGVLGEMYGGTTETRFARDLEQVLAWLSGGKEPTTVQEASFHEDRLLTLRTRNSAAYKGIYALLMRDGGRDWMKNHELGMAAFFNYKIDIHHIFPKAWCVANEIDQYRRESIVNKTALSKETNIRIGSRSPAAYVGVIETKADITSEDLDDILRSHAINPEALRAADFDGFFAARANALLELIQGAMKKSPVRADQTTSAESEKPNQYEDEPAEPDTEPVFAEESAA